MSDAPNIHGVATLNKMKVWAGARYPGREVAVLAGRGAFAEMLVDCSCLRTPLIEADAQRIRNIGGPDVYLWLDGAAWDVVLVPIEDLRHAHAAGADAPIWTSEPS